MNVLSCLSDGWNWKWIWSLSNGDEDLLSPFLNTHTQVINEHTVQKSGGQVVTCEITRRGSRGLELRNNEAKSHDEASSWYKTAVTRWAQPNIWKVSLQCSSFPHIHKCFVKGFSNECSNSVSKQSKCVYIHMNSEIVKTGQLSKAKVSWTVWPAITLHIDQTLKFSSTLLAVMLSSCPSLLLHSRGSRHCYGGILLAFTCCSSGVPPPWAEQISSYAQGVQPGLALMTGTWGVLLRSLMANGEDQRSLFSTPCLSGLRLSHNELLALLLVSPHQIDSLVLSPSIYIYISLVWQQECCCILKHLSLRLSLTVRCKGRYVII